VTAASYDRLDELHAVSVPGLVAGSRIQVLHGRDPLGPTGEVILWATGGADDLDGTPIFLPAVAVARLIEVLQGAPGSGEVGRGR
jgi:hypothetical protein